MTFLPFIAQILEIFSHSLTNLFFSLPSNCHSLTLTSPKSQNPFLLKSPTALFPNLFDIFLHPNLSDHPGCVAPWPCPCTYRIPPSLSLLTSYLLCFLSTVSLVLFSSLNLASPIKSVFRALSLLFLVLSHSLLGFNYHSHGAKTQNSTLVFHMIYLMGVFLLGVPQTPPSDSAQPELNQPPSPTSLFWLLPLAGTAMKGAALSFPESDFPGLFTIPSPPRSCHSCTRYSF